jgi:hypothetical protein
MEETIDPGPPPYCPKGTVALLDASDKWICAEDMDYVPQFAPPIDTPAPKPTCNQGEIAVLNDAGQWECVGAEFAAVDLLNCPAGTKPALDPLTGEAYCEPLAPEYEEIEPDQPQPPAQDLPAFTYIDGSLYRATFKTDGSVFFVYPDNTSEVFNTSAEFLTFWMTDQGLTFDQLTAFAPADWLDYWM